MDDPDIPEALMQIQALGVPIDPDDVTYFLGRETIVVSDRPGMAKWREKLFVLMARNAVRATAFFKLPPERVVELGLSRNVKNALALDVARAARGGGRAFVVGGWVRDQLRGESSKDIDIEVFGIPAAELSRLLATLGRVEPAARAFPFTRSCGRVRASLPSTSPRRESKRGRGHKAFDVRAIRR